MNINIKKIIELRKYQKLTITRVAEHLNKARSTVSNWENGKTIPSKTDLLALAMLLKTNITEISEYQNLPSNNVPFNQNSDFSPVSEYELSAINKVIEESSIPDSLVVFIETLLKDYKYLDSANHSLKRNNIRLISIMNSINEIIYIKDIKRNFRKVNDKFILYLKPGYTQDDIIGTKSIDIFGPKEFKEIIILENTVFKSGKRIVDEKIKIPGSSGRKHGLICIEPIFDAFHKIIEIAVSIKDITLILQNTDNLELLRSICNKIEEQIWIISEHPLKYKFIGGSNVENMYGISKENIMNDPLLMVKMMHPEDRPKYKYDSNCFPLSPGEHTFRIIDDNGSVRWIKSTVYRTFDYDNKALFYGISCDITKKKMNDFKRLVMEKAMMKIEDAMWVYGPNLDCVLITDAANKLYGFSLNKIKNPIQYWTDNILSPDFMPEYKSKFSDFIKQKKDDPYFVPSPFIFKALMPDGTTKYIESIFSCIEFDNVIYDIAVDRDISGFYNDKIKLNNIISYVEKNKCIPEKIKKKLSNIIT